MKISKIAALCRKSKEIVLCQGDGVQFVGTSKAMYRVDNLPELNQDILYTLFDVPNGKESDYLFRQIDPDFFDLRDNDAHDADAERFGLPILYGGSLIQCCDIPDICAYAFLDGAYLSPLLDEQGSIALSMRADRMPMFLVKTGFILRAVIFPERVEREALKRALNEMAAATDKLVNAKRDALQPEVIAQTRLDPDTGELIDGV